MFFRLGLALVLSLAAPRPAWALIEIVGSEHVYFEWAPASGPVASYRIYVTVDDGSPELYSNVSGRTGETLYGHYGETIVVRVAAADAAGNEGPLSPPSEAVRFVEAPPDPAPPPPPPPAADPLPPQHDFDGDGRSDVWLIDPKSGRLQLWSVAGDGFGLISQMPGLPRSWSVVASLDADGDGSEDLLWRNAETGRLDLWLLRGGQPLGGDTVRGPEGADWSVATAGDFDGDGRGDILMWHPERGDLEVWLMDATVVTEVVPWTDGPTAAGGWSAAGGGDYDGDGLHDVLWHRRAAGQLEAWLVRSPEEIEPAVFDDALDPGWHVAGSGDADGDGTEEVLLRHVALSQVETRSLDGAFVAYPDPGDDHELVEVGDFDGDGRVDLMWSAEDGTFALFLSAGAAGAGWAEPGDPWNPEAPPAPAPNACPGDMNGDGRVGFPDFNALRRCYGRSDLAKCERADLDGDGHVGLSDFSLFRSSFGTQCGD